MDPIPFPPIGPSVFEITLFGVTLALRWYALAYIAGLLGGLWLIKRACATPRLWSGPAPLTGEQVDRLLTWVIIGVIAGGRLGYVLAYNPGIIWTAPWRIPAIWEGGMSFHGGFLGVVIAGLWFARREGVAALTLGDLMAMVAPIGIGLGRIANFINAELWGRPTDLPWSVAFPGEAAQTCAGVVGICGRHPSQLYEAALEGLILGAVVLWLVWRKGWLARPGAVTGVFLVGYGLSRFVVEFVRQPDAQFISPGNPLGLALHVGGWGLTMGQLLSLPMIAAGVWLLTRRPTLRQAT